MSRTQYYVATSLDGFIADADDSLDWLFAARSLEGGPPGYAAFLAEVGAIAMGARTYEWILAHTGGGSAPEDVLWPYAVPCWVFTHRELPRARSDAPLQLTSSDVTTVHERMRAAAGGRNTWIVGGGELAGQFADAGLLDELLVHVTPVTLGAGAPLLPRRLPLRLADVTRSRDFACLRYTVVTERSLPTDQ